VKAVNVSQLKNNPSEVLRLAREGVVVVMSRDRPEDEELLDEPGVRTALAVALFKDGSLALGRAAKLADIPLVDFMQPGLSLIQVDKLGYGGDGAQPADTRSADWPAPDRAFGPRGLALTLSDTQAWSPQAWGLRCERGGMGISASPSAA
jgi:hypothetical protein